MTAVMLLGRKPKSPPSRKADNFESLQLPLNVIQLNRNFNRYQSIQTLVLPKL